MKCRINENRDYKKLCGFFVNEEGEYLGYIDSVYYDTERIAQISNMFDNMFNYSKKEFLEAFFAELRKYVNVITMHANRKQDIEFLNIHQFTLGIQKVYADENCVNWSFV